VSRSQLGIPRGKRGKKTKGGGGGGREKRGEVPAAISKSNVLQRKGKKTFLTEKKKKMTLVCEKREKKEKKT